ncbi:uncharacterized protein METZ01_LOCUS32659 [marine metagenome]|uniref:Uncharacterized protein n=1 Tax=marine metagenome TaxID=408172 RepID=A0A381QKD7_9ZZZZ
MELLFSGVNMLGLSIQLSSYQLPWRASYRADPELFFGAGNKIRNRVIDCPQESEGCRHRQ